MCLHNRITERTRVRRNKSLIAIQKPGKSIILNFKIPVTKHICHTWIGGKMKDASNFSSS